MSDEKQEPREVKPNFQKALENLINQYSMERAGADTPDFLLAEYLNMCLTAYSRTVNRRDELRNKKEDKPPITVPK